MTAETDRIDKLPKWAQTIIHILKQHLAEQIATVAELRDLAEGNQDTNVYINHYHRQNTLLPSDSRITFQLGDSRVEIRHSDQLLYVSCYSSRLDLLKVIPSSSNALYLGVEDRD